MKLCTLVTLMLYIRIMQNCSGHPPGVTQSVVKFEINVLEHLVHLEDK